MSGIYIAHLTRTDTGGDNHIVFVVRDDASHSDLLFQTSDTTWQAYNDWGGNSLYSGQPARPGLQGQLQPAVQHPRDRHRRPRLRLRRRIPDGPVARGQRLRRQLLHRRRHRPPTAACSPTTRRSCRSGHDEYWSGQQRANVEAARDAGVNLAFFSGNEVFWKTRWEPSIDALRRPAYRTLVCYKETKANAVIDPADPPTWTGTWRDPRFSPPADGGRPENALTGTIFTVNVLHVDAIQVPAAYGQLRFWRNTSIASLARGQVGHARRPARSATSGTRTVDNGFRPAGLIELSVDHRRTSRPRSLDYGSNVGTGHRDAQPDALPRPERGPGLRRRHRAVVVGPRRATTTANRAARPTSGCSRRRSTCSPTWVSSRAPCSRASSRPPPPPTRQRRPRRSRRRRPAPTCPTAPR